MHSVHGICSGIARVMLVQCPQLACRHPKHRKATCELEDSMATFSHFFMTCLTVVHLFILVSYVSSICAYNIQVNVFRRLSSLLRRSFGDSADFTQGTRNCEKYIYIYITYIIKISKQLHCMLWCLYLPEQIPHSQSVKWSRMASFVGH